MLKGKGFSPLSKPEVGIQKRGAIQDVESIDLIFIEKSIHGKGDRIHLMRNGVELPNESYEAYTENHAGRRGDRTPQGLVQPR